MGKKVLESWWAIFLLGITLYVILIWSDLQSGQFLTKGNLLMMAILIGGGFQLYTWRNDDRAKKDERGRLIIQQSSVLSYRILTIALFVLWVIDRRMYHPDNELGNTFLFIALCLSLVLSPLLQLVTARRYL
ncbi:hypothetical protein COLU111180_07400 [Cohnella lubricantis]|uniref:DUF2178 domain-containing protein n=1 Tax=Cohnella lubricantis TaxID=2163172 RepID=A0A841TB49_9BACL|nr:hypothetical protein [Cohnella lubricantis]MBB6678524.1 hypothetical protein [Cohnella lubricantis]MBP2119167.1 nicotinamide riboside transporter PnuC [Cohnella lubricantis]